MLEAAKASPRVLASPEPMVWLKGFGERAVEFDVRVWISDPEAGVGSVQGDILTRIWDLFRENGITLPYPPRDIPIRSFPKDMTMPRAVTTPSCGPRFSVKRPRFSPACARNRRGTR